MAPVEALIPFHRALASLDPATPPTAVQACGPELRRVRRLAALPGSFNPPHRAHEALLRAARETWRADATACVLAARTVDKERVTGLWLEDRLWLLCELMGTRSAVVATNRGLYVDQAVALRSLCPELEALAFVTGYDKIVQIFDSRYYVNRDGALEELFSLAELLVAPRGGATSHDLASLLARPENARFAHRVTALPLPPDLADVSSTGAREGGKLSDVPERAREVIRRSGCYADPVPARYAARAEAIRAAASAPGA